MTELSGGTGKCLSYLEAGYQIQAFGFLVGSGNRESAIVKRKYS